jgi:FKBP-type peptidyl-prolyl cis-trans isomerase 2
MSRNAELQTIHSGPQLKVRKNRKVVLHYRVMLPSGEEFDATTDSSPLEIVCGRGDTIHGLEKRILGMEPGEQREFVVPPEEAFGAYDAKLLQRIGREDLPMGVDPRVGMVIPFSSKGCEVVGRVVDVTPDSVTADLNHPLAGQSLHYEVRVLEVEDLCPDAAS